MCGFVARRPCAAPGGISAKAGRKLFAIIKIQTRKREKESET